MRLDIAHHMTKVVLIISSIYIKVANFMVRVSIVELLHLLSVFELRLSIHRSNHVFRFIKRFFRHEFSSLSLSLEEVTVCLFALLFQLVFQVISPLVSSPSVCNQEPIGKWKVHGVNYVSELVIVVLGLMNQVLDQS